MTPQTDGERDRKLRARKTLRRALKKGTLARAACVECGAEETEGHHPDYSKPLEVVWLCHEHHMRRHKGERKPREIKATEPEPFDWDERPHGLTLTPAQAAVELQISVRSVQNLLKRGVLPGFQLERRWRIGAQALADYVNQRERE